MKTFGGSISRCSSWWSGNIFDKDGLATGRKAEVNEWLSERIECDFYLIVELKFHVIIDGSFAVRCESMTIWSGLPGFGWNSRVRVDQEGS